MNHTYWMFLENCYSVSEFHACILHLKITTTSLNYKMMSYYIAHISLFSSVWFFFYIKGTTSQLMHFEMFSLNFSSLSFDMCQPSSSLTILVTLWFILLSLIKCFLIIVNCYLKFFLQFKSNFVHGQSNSKYYMIELL